MISKVSWRFNKMRIFSPPREIWGRWGCCFCCVCFLKRVSVPLRMGATHLSNHLLVRLTCVRRARRLDVRNVTFQNKRRKPASTQIDVSLHELIRVIDLPTSLSTESLHIFGSFLLLLMLMLYTRLIQKRILILHKQTCRGYFTA